MGGSGIHFLQKDREVHKFGSLLPHWEQGEVPCFVTWRLGDSLPQICLQRWRFERQQWLLAHPQPWSPQTEAQYYQTFGAQIDRWLDQGMGSCWLRRPALRQHVGDTLHFADGQSYRLCAFVAMPNHVHVLFQPLRTTALHVVVKAWKSVSARKINRLSSRTGSLWQRHYWDRLIRSPAHCRRVLRYIEENPETDGLKPSEYTLWIEEGFREELQQILDSRRFGS